jgi:fatty acid desaturase
MPARLRLLWLPVHYGVIALCTIAIGRQWVATAFQPLLSLLMGASFAGLTFVGHETLHGAIVRDRSWRRFIGWLAFLPFAVSPRLWEAWHNRVHHGHTNHPGIDPDAYPTLAEYRASKSLQRMTDWLSPGRGRAAGVISLLVGFTVQSTHMLVAAPRNKFLSSRQYTIALLESGGAWAILALLAFSLGPLGFLMAFGLPLLVGNSIIMSLILTNHSLSPHTDVNDPLINSLSVSGPRLLEWLTLGFGFHVEHHLFPAMSGRHARELRGIVVSRWPDRYQAMPYLRALRLLHQSPRVYRNDTTLVDPIRGDVWQTLRPGLERFEVRDQIGALSFVEGGRVAMQITTASRIEASSQGSGAAVVHERGAIADCNE